MASSSKYTPSKGGGIKPGGGVAAGSLLAASLTGDFYSTAIPRVVRGFVADLGAGESPLRPFLEAHSERVVALDWPGSYHDVRVDAFADLNRGVPLRDGSLHTVLLSDVLEHLRQPEALLEECRRVLCAGGVLLGNVPFMYWLHEQPHDFFRYTEYGLRAMLRDAGFGDPHIVVLGGGIDVLVDITAKLVSRTVPVVGSPAARLLQRAWMGLRRLRCLRAGESHFPLSYGFVATAR